MILGGVNFGSTFLGLYVVENFGRRKSLIFGALWMFMCFLIFASMGHFLLFMGKDAKTAGYVMIVFTCLFILVYAMTWVRYFSMHSENNTLTGLFRLPSCGHSFLKSTLHGTVLERWAMRPPVTGHGVSCVHFAAAKHF